MKVILNADDFGRSDNVNAAVMLAHRQGVLTSTSLMVGADAAQQAVQMARETPTLAVGLHVVVMDGRPTLPPRDIPRLVDRDGFLPAQPLPLGLRYFFSRTAQRELVGEIEAQFEKFMATGLPLAHVDCHCHMHVHPTVFDLLVPLAERYGAKGIRVPRDELWPALRHDRRQAGMKVAWAIAFSLLGRRCVRRLQGHRLAFTDRVYGLMQTGQMQEAYVVGLLRRMKVPSAEFYFHPATEPTDERLGPNPGDLATLLSPAVRQIIEERGLERVTYAALREG